MQCVKREGLRDAQLRPCDVLESFVAAQKSERKRGCGMVESTMIVLGKNGLDSRYRWNLTGQDIRPVSLDRSRPYTQRREELR